MARKNDDTGPHGIVPKAGRMIDPDTYLDDPMHLSFEAHRIAPVSETTLEGEEVIDVSGMVVGPGLFPAMGARRLVKA